MMGTPTPFEEGGGDGWHFKVTIVKQLGHTLPCQGAFKDKNTVSLVLALSLQSACCLCVKAFPKNV